MLYPNAILRLSYSRGISRLFGGCRLSSECSFVAAQSVVDDENSEEPTDTDTLRRQVLQCRRKNTAHSLPTKLQNLIADLLNDHTNVDEITKGAAILNNQLWSRRPPSNNDEIKEMTRQLLGDKFAHILQKMDKGQRKAATPQIKEKVVEELRRRVYRWHPMKYDKFGALCYLVGRTPMEFAVLRKVFDELRFLDPLFEPQSCLDFGSGIGSVWWAMKERYPSSFTEYFSIERAQEMKELARHLAQGNNPAKELSTPEYSQRTQLPMRHSITYDMVVSAFSLMEIQNRRERIETVENLWAKTNRHLVIIENGTIAGFTLVNEARSCILKMNDNAAEIKAHVLAPCTHSLPCQRLNADSPRHPCSFKARYLDFLNPTKKAAEAFYSYVVLSKVQPEMLFDGPPCSRIIEEVLPRSRHVVCRVCTSKGDIVQKVFTKGKHNKDVYQSSRSSKWGDLFLYEDIPSASTLTKSFRRTSLKEERHEDDHGDSVEK